MKKILVLNDDQDTMSLIEIWLERKGYDVKFTANKKEEINLVESFSPTLIIIDILQLETLLAIRHIPEYKNVPMLLMTGQDLGDFNDNLPVDNFIEKPFDIALFERKINNLVEDNVAA